MRSCRCCVRPESSCLGRRSPQQTYSTTTASALLHKAGSFFARYLCSGFGSIPCNWVIPRLRQRCSLHIQCLRSPCVIPVTFEPTPALMSVAPEPVPLLVQGLDQRARRRRRAPRVQRWVTAARRTRAGAGRRPNRSRRRTKDYHVFATWYLVPDRLLRPIDNIAQLSRNLARRMSDSALFLDPDGVTHVDRGYIHRRSNSSSVPAFSRWLVSGPMSCDGRSLS
jgi:hypothetical protein